MKNYARLFAGVMFLTMLMLISVVDLAGASVPAQVTDTDTPVATATITAVGGYLPTVQPTYQADNLACGTGLPSGWGTVTPDSLWSVICQNCVYTPMPTSTINPTVGTEIALTASPTVTATATYTPTSTALPGTNVRMDAVSIVDLGAMSIDWDYRSPNCNNTLDNVEGLANDFYVSHGVTNQTNYGIGEDTLFSAVYFDNTTASTVIVYYTLHFVYDYLEGSWGTSNIRFCWNTCNSPYIHDVSGSQEDHTYDVTGQFTLAANQANKEFLFRIIHPNTMCVTSSPKCLARGQVYAQFQTGSLPGGYYTPTPVATSVVSYCTSVNGGASPVETGFSWTGIQYGTQSCFDIGPLDEIDTGFLTFDNIGIPWIAHLCLQEIDIGVITIFGVTVSLLVIAYIVGVAMIIRNMFVS